MSRGRFTSRFRFLLIAAVLGLLIQACGTSGPGGGGSASLQAPYELIATPVATGVALSWTDNSQSETGFEVERRFGAGAFELIASLPSSTTTYTEAGLTVSGEYGYRVRAVSDDSASTYSPEATYSFARIIEGSPETQIVSSGDTVVGVVPDLVHADFPLSISVSGSTTKDADYALIGSTIRVILPKSSLNLLSEEPLLIVTPPDASYTSTASSASIAWVEVITASGEPTGFFANYNLGDIPIEIWMTDLHQIDQDEGLPAMIELTITPIDLMMAPAEAGLESQAYFADFIFQDTGLYRLDLPSDPNQFNPGDICLDGNRVVDLESTRSAFFANSAFGAQAAWTSEQGKLPLVLVIGWQGNPVGSAIFKRRNDILKLNLRSYVTNFAAHLCGWTEVITTFANDPELRDRFTLYTFAYDSVRERIHTNGENFQRALDRAFGADPAFIVAHSMGGLVTHQAMQLGANVGHLYSLGTPYRGSVTIECTKVVTDQTRGDQKFCDRVVNQVQPDRNTQISSTFLQAQLIGLTFPGSKDLAFESAFGLYRVGIPGIPASPLAAINLPAKDNPYLERLNGTGMRFGHLITSFHGNVLTSLGNVDRDAYPAFQGTLGKLIYTLRGLRFSDGVVSTESAAFLDLKLLQRIPYLQLAHLTDQSPFSRVVLVPCTAHTELTQAGRLLGPPSGSNCDSSTLSADGTIYNYISRDLMERVGPRERDAIVGGTIDGLPSGNWRVAAYDMFDSQFVGSSVPVLSDNSFSLTLLASNHTGPARRISLGSDVFLMPANTLFRQATLLVFNDVNGNGLFDSNETIRLIYDPDNTFAEEEYQRIQLWHGSESYSISGQSITTTGWPVAWAISLDAGWGRWYYGLASGNQAVNVRGTNRLTGLGLTAGSALTVSSASTLNLNDLHLLAPPH